EEKSKGFVKLLLSPESDLPLWPPEQSRSLEVFIDYINRNIVRVSIKDPKDSESFNSDEVLEKELNREQFFDGQYAVSYNKKHFSFSVVRKSTGTIIFDTSSSDILFGKRFKQITSVIGTNHSCIYGLAEHMTDLCLPTNKRTIYTLFNRGDLPHERNDPQFDLYGFHPFYVALEHDASAHGVYLYNTYAMDIVVQPDATITYRTVGGQLDLFFMLGPEPDQVTSQYTTIVGRPFLPPYWALGFHLCRYKYNSTEAVRKVWKRTIDAGIPFEAQWNDIDFMDNYKIFTYDAIQYKGLPNFIKEVHNENMKYVINISPALSAMEPKGTYKPFEMALQKKLLIIDPKTNKPMNGTCWHKDTVWLDFTNPETKKFWYENLHDFQKQIQFDGIWLDMNEPYSFRSLKDMNCDMNETLMNIPYNPGGEPLSNSTLCMYARHKIGSHFDVHTIHALYESKATVNALRSIYKQKRPFVMSRSSTSGQGRYSSHWNGDVTSEWKTMRATIPNMLTFNIIGMPLIGADLCGFVGNTTEDLCLRWNQLGAFYSFSRNHNDYDTIEQDPVAMGPEVTASAKKSFQYRYSLLPYLYTLFYKAYLYGTTVVRPLFYEFPNDDKLYKMSEQFMWGSAIMFNPALYESHDTVSTYFPKGQWFSNFRNEIVGPITVLIKTSNQEPNINFRAGYIVPMQDSAKTTVDSRKNPFDLLIYIDNQTQRANGELYWDDGETEPLKYTKVIFEAIRIENKVIELKTNAVNLDYTISKMIIGKVFVIGINRVPLIVEYNSKTMEMKDNVKIQNNILKINLHFLSISLLNANKILLSF
ncbi:lysosomal alpha-glucosidase-like protein, partial [Leptotrombidium deliense]